MYKKIKIFSDSASEKLMFSMNKNIKIDGLTTNPSLMRKNGIKNYKRFALKVLKKIKKKPVSFEVFADDEKKIIEQGKKISTWGKNVYVKIPIINTQGKYLTKAIRLLSKAGVKVNVTAIMNVSQAKIAIRNLSKNTPSYISVFAGRIADTGRDPELIVKQILKIIKSNKKCELIWASTREFFNIIQAEKIGCHIITITEEIFLKFKFLNYSLQKFTKDTVISFYTDAKQSGYEI